MEKICLVSWRRKDRLPEEAETTAQRRARTRERRMNTEWPAVVSDVPQSPIEAETLAQRRARNREMNGISLTPPEVRIEQVAGVETPQDVERDLSMSSTYSTAELTDEDLAGIVIPEILRDVRQARGKEQKASDESSMSTVLLELTLTQSQTLRTLPLTARALAAGETLHCQLVESPYHQNVILRWSRHANTTSSVMSLKDVSETLHLTRSAIMRFVQEGQLRAQRLANRYVFTAEDVRTFRNQCLPTSTSQWSEQ